MDNNLNIKKLLESIGYVNLKETNTHYQTAPLYRNSDNQTALVVLKTDGAYYDFVEKHGGSLTELVQRTLKIEDRKVAEKILTDGQISLEPSRTNYESHISMQKTFDKSLLDKLIKNHDYWINRGISQKTIEPFLGGITFNGRMSNRYVFPILTDKDELVGFSGRLLDNNSNYPKWKILSAKKNWVYPTLSYPEINKKQSVILVESIGNLLSFYEVGIKNVIVTFGISISPAVIEYLLKIDIGHIIICFDNDSFNNQVGNREATISKKKLSKYFDEEQVSILTPQHKDINEWLLNDKDGLVHFCKENNL